MTEKLAGSDGLLGILALVKEVKAGYATKSKSKAVLQAVADELGDVKYWIYTKKAYPGWYFLEAAA